jgi:hypothetical protein
MLGMMVREGSGTTPFRIRTEHRYLREETFRFPRIEMNRGDKLRSPFPLLEIEKSR